MQEIKFIANNSCLELNNQLKSSQYEIIVKRKAPVIARELMYNASLQGL